VFLVTRAVEKAYYAVASFAFDKRDRLGVTLQLALVSPAASAPLMWVMPEPFWKLGAGRDFFQPKIQLCSDLAQTARLQLIHKDARAMSPFRFFIHPLEFDDHCIVESLSNTHRPLDS
jgi:hypothetical protein